MHQKIYRGIYIVLGFIFLGIGAVGVVLPVLPTTPFLLLSSYFFAKGSERFHNWLINTSFYKKHIHEFFKTRSMTLKTKWTILVPASIMLAIAFYFSPIWHAQVAIVLLILFKYYYFFFRIKTIKAETT